MQIQMHMQLKKLLEDINRYAAAAAAAAARAAAAAAAAGTEAAALPGARTVVAQKL